MPRPLPGEGHLEMALGEELDLTVGMKGFSLRPGLTLQHLLYRSRHCQFFASFAATLRVPILMKSLCGPPTLYLWRYKNLCLLQFQRPPYECFFLGKIFNQRRVRQKEERVRDLDVETKEMVFPETQEVNTRQKICPISNPADQKRLCDDQAPVEATEVIPSPPAVPGGVRSTAIAKCAPFPSLGLPHHIPV